MNDASSFALARLHAIKHREAALFFDAAFLAAIYVDPSNQTLLK